MSSRQTVSLKDVSVTLFTPARALDLHFSPDRKMNAARKLQKQSELQQQSPGAASRSSAARSSLLVPGRNCWRVERAEHASFLVDGDSYFRAFRAAAIKARHSIIILGWDFDSRIRMLIDREPDGFPDRFGEFLHALLIRRRQLHIYVLTWDFHMIYWKEREWWLPSKLVAHRRLHFHKDGAHPVGASHHQKVVIVDDVVAFVGGLDFAQCRWDTSRIVHSHPDRVLLTDETPCRPFHDVQLMVSGPVAEALGELARDRWRVATGRSMRPVVQGRPEELWPEAVKPELSDVPVAIARTAPAFGERASVNEVEALVSGQSEQRARSHLH